MECISQFKNQNKNEEGDDDEGVMVRKFVVFILGIVPSRRPTFLSFQQRTNGDLYTADLSTLPHTEPGIHIVDHDHDQGKSQVNLPYPFLTVPASLIVLIPSAVR
jgi:hypothetical protein